jgi:hypothetical protein
MMVYGSTPSPTINVFILVHREYITSLETLDQQ